MESDKTEKICLKPERITPFMKQLYSALSAALLVLACGAAMGYSAVLLPQLEDEDGNIKINPTTSSWIASMPGVALPFTNIFGGWCIERLGRKITTQLIVVPMTVGWMVIAMSNNLNSMIVGRLLQGITMGAQATVSSIYIGEISSPQHRTLFLSTIATATAMGIFISHLLGTFLHWKMTAVICSFFTFLCGVMISFSPETPSWLVSKNEIERATRSFVWYRGESEKDELDAMVSRKLKENVEKLNVQEDGMKKKWKLLFLTLSQREFYLPLYLMFNFFVLLQFSGNNVITFYSIQIIRSTMGKDLNEYAIMLSLDTIRLVSSIFAGLILSKCRRKTAVLVSGSLSFLCLLSLSVFLILSQNGFVHQSLSWVPLACLGTFMMALSVGVVPLPWSILGEVFPLKSRSLGVSLSTFFTSTLYFLAAKTAPFMFEYWGMPGTFCFYAGMTLITVSIIYHMIPDTRFRTLQQIEDAFSKPQTAGTEPHREQIGDDEDSSRGEEIKTKKEVGDV